MQIKTVEDLFYDGLKDIYYGENKIVAALPKMAAAAKAASLKAAFEKHLEQTKTHIQRLEQVFDALGKPAKGKTCPAIDAIIEEGEQIIAEYADSPALDLGLIAGAQAVEHYEIVKYRALKKLATSLGLTDAVDLLDATLQEEMETDADLDSISDAGDSGKAKKR
jgi:ferritin-like metal-binding protein YciE